MSPPNFLDRFHEPWRATKMALRYSDGNVPIVPTSSERPRLAEHLIMMILPFGAACRGARLEIPHHRSRQQPRAWPQLPPQAGLAPMVEGLRALPASAGCIASDAANAQVLRHQTSIVPARKRKSLSEMVFASENCGVGPAGGANNTKSSDTILALPCWQCLSPSR